MDQIGKLSNFLVAAEKETDRGSVVSCASANSTWIIFCEDRGILYLSFARKEIDLYLVCTCVFAKLYLCVCTCLGICKKYNLIQ